MRCIEPQSGQPEPLPSGLIICQVCHLAAPFTAAIQAGLTLGQICTCVIEQRAIARLARKQHAPQQKEQTVSLPPPFFDTSKQSDVSWADTVGYRPTISDVRERTKADE